MEISDIIAIAMSCSTLFATFWIFYKGREDKRRIAETQNLKEYTDQRVSSHDKAVDNLGERANSLDTKIEDAGRATDTKFEDMSKRVSVLESQLVGKDIVSERMLDDRVRPLEASVAKLEHTVEQGFSDGKKGMQNVLIALSRLSGKLEGSGVIRGDHNHE